MMVWGLVTPGARECGENLEKGEIRHTNDSIDNKIGVGEDP